MVDFLPTGAEFGTTSGSSILRSLLSACVVELMAFFKGLSETAWALPWTFLFLVGVENILSDCKSAEAARSRKFYQAAVGALVGVKQA